MALKSCRKSSSAQQNHQHQWGILQANQPIKINDQRVIPYLPTEVIQSFEQGVHPVYLDTDTLRNSRVLHLCMPINPERQDYNVDDSEVDSEVDPDMPTLSPTPTPAHLLPPPPNTTSIGMYYGVLKGEIHLDDHDRFPRMIIVDDVFSIWHDNTVYTGRILRLNDQHGWLEKIRF